MIKCWRQHAKNPIILTPELNKELSDELFPILKSVKEKVNKCSFIYAKNTEVAKTITHERRVPGKWGEWEIIKEED